jgi:hypothetical protein
MSRYRHGKNLPAVILIPFVISESPMHNTSFYRLLLDSMQWYIQFPIADIKLKLSYELWSYEGIIPINRAGAKR